MRERVAKCLEATALYIPEEDTPILIFGIFLVLDDRFFASIADVGLRILLHSLNVVRAASALKCLGGDVEQVNDDLNLPGSAARTLGAHQIPGIRR